MHLSQQKVAEFKEIWIKEYGQDLDDATAREYAQNLIGLFEALLEVRIRIAKWDARLENEPDGFHIPSGGPYDCRICCRQVSGEQGWYDQYGIKCLPCQEALWANIIPTSICTDRDGWYAIWELEGKFGLHHSTIRKMIRTGKLKARAIKNKGQNWYWVFLKAENPSLQEDDGITQSTK